MPVPSQSHTERPPSEPDAFPERFFVTGGTVPADSPAYVERRADGDLLDALLRGEYCYVLNTRQMGKSSLSVRTIRKLNGQGVRTVFLDLTAFGGQNATPDRWYLSLAAEVGRQLEIREEFVGYLKEQQDKTQVFRLFGALRNVAPERTNAPLVIFVDEIDIVRSLPFPTDEFFAAIRACYNLRSTDPPFHRLTFCLLGVATPADLIVDTKTSPFNIGRRINLTDFTAEEARPFAQWLPGGENALRRVLHWTGGHPYLTQRLCHAVVEKGARSTRDIDLVCDALFLSKSARETDDNLSFVRNRLLRSDADLPSLLDLYRKVRAGKRVRDDETNPLCATLRLSGVCRTERDLLVVRNRIYDRVFDARWVESHMPDAELRRQREAYRRGVTRATALSGAVTVAFGVLSFVAITKANEANALSRTANEQRRAAEDASRQARVASRWARASEDQAKAQANEARRQTVIARREERIAREAEKNAKSLTLRLEDALDAARMSEGKATRAADAARHSERQVAESLRRETLRNGISLLEEGDLEPAIRRLTEVLQLDERFFPERIEADRKRLAFAERRRLAPTVVLEAGGPVRKASFSPDGSRIVTVTTDGRMRLFDVAGRFRVVTERRWNTTIFDVAFSPDGQRFALLTADARGYLYDAASGRRIATLVHFEKPERLGEGGCVAFSPDRKYLATGIRPGTAIWDARTGDEVGRVRWEDTGDWDARWYNRVPLIPTALAFSPDRPYLACVYGGYQSNGATLRFPEIGKLETVYPGCWSGRAVHYSPDGSKVLIVGEYGQETTAVLYDANISWKRGLPIGDRPGGVDGVFSPDGKRVALISSDNAGRIYDTFGRAVGEAFRHRSPIRTVRYDWTGQWLVTASADGTARVWDSRNGRNIGGALGHPAEVTFAEFSPDSRFVLTACQDGKVRLWPWDFEKSLRDERIPPPMPESVDRFKIRWEDTEGEVLKFRTNGAHPEATAFVNAVTRRPEPIYARLPGEHREDGPQRKWSLVRVGKEYRIYERATGRLLRTFPDRGQEFGLTVTGDTLGRYLFCLFPDGRRGVLDSKTGRVLPDDPTGFFFPALGKHLPLPYRRNDASFVDSPSRMTTVRWLVEDGTGRSEERFHVFFLDQHASRIRDLGMLPLFRQIVISPNDRYLVIDGANAGMYDTGTGKRLASLCGPREKVISLAISPNGERIAVGTADKTVFVIDAHTRRRIGAVTALPSPAARLAFSPDARSLAMACSDGSITVRETDNGDPLTPILRQTYGTLDLRFTSDGKNLLVLRSVNNERVPYLLSLF